MLSGLFLGRAVDQVLCVWQYGWGNGKGGCALGTETCPLIILANVVIVDPAHSTNSRCFHRHLPGGYS